MKPLRQSFIQQIIFGAIILIVIYELIFAFIILLLNILNLFAEIHLDSNILLIGLSLLLSVLFFAKKYQSFLKYSEKVEQKINFNKMIGRLSPAFWRIITFLIAVIVILLLWSIIVNYLI